MFVVRAKSGGSPTEHCCEYSGQRAERRLNLADVVQQCRSPRRSRSPRGNRIEATQHHQRVALIGGAEPREELHLSRQQHLTDLTRFCRSEWCRSKARDEPLREMPKV
jgi:hypothetical protein